MAQLQPAYPPTQHRLADHESQVVHTNTYTVHVGSAYFRVYEQGGPHLAACLWQVFLWGVWRPVVGHAPAENVLNLGVSEMKSEALCIPNTFLHVFTSKLDTAPRAIHVLESRRPIIRHHVNSPPHVEHIN